MAEKVRVKFMHYKNVVLMEVLEMPEKYRNGGKLIASKRASIYSLDSPQIRADTLYLRGDKAERDNYCSTCVYNTTTDALEAINRFSSLIHELNERDAETTESDCRADEFEITVAE